MHTRVHGVRRLQTDLVHGDVAGPALRAANQLRRRLDRLPGIALLGIADEDQGAVVALRIAAQLAGTVAGLGLHGGDIAVGPLHAHAPVPAVGLAAAAAARAAAARAAAARGDAPLPAGARTRAARRLAVAAR